MTLEGCMLLRTFKIIAFVDDVPSMGTCTKCGYKIFTPLAEFAGQYRSAEIYLLNKFAEHDCTVPKKPVRSVPQYRLSLPKKSG
jgi:hypothetical protein